MGSTLTKAGRPGCCCVSFFADCIYELKPIDDNLLNIDASTEIKKVIMAVSNF